MMIIVYIIELYDYQTGFCPFESIYNNWENLLALVYGFLAVCNFMVMANRLFLFNVLKN